MKIRRYEIDYIFKTLEPINLDSDVTPGNVNFICIPRYNACIHLRASSIRFFFNYVYKVRTHKTYLIWFMLRIIAIFPGLHAILNTLGLQHEMRHIKSSNQIDWNQIDLLYIEWHFFGIFSKSKKTVTHVLAKEAYNERFQNELNARQLGNQFKNLSKVFPKLLKVSENPKFYVEELAVDSGNQLIENDQLVVAQKKIKKLNRKTLKQIPLDQYYHVLIKKLGQLKNEKLLNALEVLKTSIEYNYLNKDINLELALVHGDFNAGQVLTKNNRIKIIDWGDGGFLNRFFDYISIVIYKSPDHSFDTSYFPEDLSVMKKFFSKKLKTKANMEVYVRITLLEILVISKGEFEAKEGAYLRWLTAVENNA